MKDDLLRNEKNFLYFPRSEFSNRILAKLIVTKLSY